MTPVPSSSSGSRRVSVLKSQLDQYTDLTYEQRRIRSDPLQGRPSRFPRRLSRNLCQRLKEQQGKPEKPEKLSGQRLTDDFGFVLFASAVIDYDYIMKLITRYSGQDPKKMQISREQLIGLIQSDAKFLDEREAITEYVRSLKEGEGLDEAPSAQARSLGPGSRRKRLKRLAPAQAHGLTAKALSRRSSIPYSSG